MYHFYNTLGNGGSQSLEEQQSTKVLSCAVKNVYALATQASSSPHLSPHPAFALHLLPLPPCQHHVHGESNDFLHLLHLTDNKDWTIQEVAFSLGIGLCAQLKIPFTIHSTETRCSGPTEHHYHPQLFSAQTNALVTFGTSCP